MFIFLKRIFKLAKEIILKNKEIFLANFIVFIIFLSLLNFLFLFLKFKDYLIEKIEKKADISLYFEAGTDINEIDRLKKALEANFQIKKIEYLPSEKVQEELLEKYKEKPEISQILEEVGPFFSVLNIQTKNTDDYEKILDFLNQEDTNKIIKDVDYFQRKEMIQKIFIISKNIQWLAFGLSFILIIISLLIIFNTVKLSVLTFKEEIMIQRLVGASDLFIKGPFIATAFLSALFESALTLLLFVLLLFIFQKPLSNFLTGFNINQLFQDKMAYFFLFNFSISFILHSFFTLVGIKKYLKV